MLVYFLLFTLAFLVSLCLTPPVRSVAQWAGVLDVPDGRRKRHSRPIPKLGGIAIFLSFYSCVWFALGYLEAPGTGEAFQLASAMFLPSLVILALGTADDLWSLGPWVKIGVQLIAGLLIFYQLNIGIEGVATPFAGRSALGMFSLPATLVWVVLVTNAFNIVDGIDGLAAGVAFIALSCMFLVSLEMGHVAIVFVVAPLAGAVLGFLRYNFNPASVFLGDSGSLFLGFQLAVLSLVASQKSSTTIGALAPLFILALPLVETATSVIRRFLAGQSILRSDTNHIHHQLISRGLEPRRAAIVLYGCAAAFGLASLFMIQSGAAVVGLIALSCAAVTWVGIQRLGYAEFAEINGAFNRLLHQRRIIQNNIISRRLADDFRTAPSVADAWSLLQGAATKLGFSYVELRDRSGRINGADSPEFVYAQRLYPATQRGLATETNFAVVLTSASGVLGEVIFSRSTAAPPLHSTLPVLIGAVAQGLSRALEKGAVSRAVLVAQQEDNEWEVNAEPRAAVGSGDVMCCSCGSFDIHRSHARSLVERLRKNTTDKRLYACGMCGWRGWMLPLVSTRADHALATARMPPDLQAIDLAIARLPRQEALVN